MTKPAEYDPNAVLYQMKDKDNDGLIVLVGTDPALADVSQFFRWPNKLAGWEERKPWRFEASEVTPAPIDNRKGTHSGWPGVVRVRRPTGRPRKEISEDQRRKSVSTTLEREELFEIMRRAADAKQSISEWVAAVLRKELVTTPPMLEESARGG